MRSVIPPNTTSAGSARVLLLAGSLGTASEGRMVASPAAGPGGPGCGRLGMTFFSPDLLRFGADSPPSASRG
eukprot:14988999-Alexandrium_andersonii.AAC.1